MLHHYGHSKPKSSLTCFFLLKIHFRVVWFVCKNRLFRSICAQQIYVIALWHHCGQYRAHTHVCPSTLFCSNCSPWVVNNWDTVFFFGHCCCCDLVGKILDNLKFLNNNNNTKWIQIKWHSQWHDGGRYWWHLSFEWSLTFIRQYKRVNQKKKNRSYHFAYFLLLLHSNEKNRILNMSSISDSCHHHTSSLISSNQNISEEISLHFSFNAVFFFCWSDTEKKSLNDTASAVNVRIHECTLWEESW